MSHGIVSTRDFVYGLAGQGKDWHGLTIERETVSPDMFPQMHPVQLQADGKDTRWQVLVSKDDNLPCGTPFDPSTFGFILPGNAWTMVKGALSGTRFSVERIGMLWDRSFWFVSIKLDELEAVAQPGQMFRLNFSGGLDGSKSPQGELSNIRAVCWNTISLSRATGEYLFKVKQTSKSQGRLDKSASDVEAACGMAKVFNATLASLADKPCTTDKARDVYAGEVIARGGELVGSVSKKTGNVRESRALNLVNDLVTLFNKGDGNKGATRADVLNGFTQRFTRGGSDDTTKNPWTALASSEFGTAGQRKSEFLNAIASDDSFNTLAENGHRALVDAKAI